MKKEVLFAVVIGSILGLVVAFGIWRANASFDPVEEIVSSVTEPSSTPAAVLNASENTSISITKPEYNEVLLEKDLAVSGITTANAYVAVYLNEVHLVKADSSGTFSVDVELSEGINHILVKSFDSSSDAKEEIIRVVFDPNIKAPSDTNAEATTATDSVREKIQQKLEQVSSKPQAVIGTVTDKTSSGFNVRNGGSELKQITVTENQTFIIKSGQTDKTLPFSDLAIGDFVAAIGYKTSAGALEADQVLIDNDKPLEKYELFIASVDEVTRQNFVFTPLAGVNDGELTVRIASTIGYHLFSNNTMTTIKSTAIKATDKVIISASRGTNSLAVEDIYVVESSSPATTPAR